MSKRLQVILSDDEMRALQDHAARDGITVSEWVRQSLRESGRRGTDGDIDTRLDALSTAMRHDFPAPDVQQMLAEIEHGYTA